MSACTLQVDAQGRLAILSQDDLDALLSGTGQDAIDARRDVRSLVIYSVYRIRWSWPVLASL